MSLDHSLFFSSQIMEGLKYLHSKNILHLDLKPANCLLCPEEGVIRLCDFGSIHILGEAWNSHGSPGTAPFRAPELFHSATPNTWSDIYSLAVTMWCFDTRQFPYPGLPYEMIVYGTLRNNLRPPVPSTDHSPFTDRFRAIYTACWASDPDERPTLSKVIARVDDIMSDLEES